MPSSENAILLVHLEEIAQLLVEPHAARHQFIVVGQRADLRRIAYLHESFLCLKVDKFEI